MLGTVRALTRMRTCEVSQGIMVRESACVHDAREGVGRMLKHLFEDDLLLCLIIPFSVWEKNKISAQGNIN